jgi:GAF domain-containing protein
MARSVVSSSRCARLTRACASHAAGVAPTCSRKDKSWLSRAADIDVENADPSGWEALRAHVVASGVKRICNAPLSAPHRVVGVLSLGRLTNVPFTQDELERVNQVAAQIAIALENAIAFEEIAALKEQLARENVYLKEEIRGTHRFEEIVCSVMIRNISDSAKIYGKSHTRLRTGAAAMKSAENSARGAFVAVLDYRLM